MQLNFIKYWSINMLKVLLCRLTQCLSPFNMLSFERSSETSIIRYLPNHVFRSPSFRKYVTYEGHLFFPKCSEIDRDFKNVSKKSEKVFCLLDNCIWIGCVKFSLLRREYLPLSVNVLRNSPKILHITKRDVFWLNFIHIDQ